MVQNTISNAIMIISAVVGAAALIGAIYPSVYTFAGTISSASGDADDRSRTLITIGAQAFNDDYTVLTFWVKNNGRSSITDNELSAARIYYGSGTTGSLKNYAVTYAIDEPGNGDTKWDPAETLAVRISSDSLPHDPGTYRLKLSLPDGVSTESTFSI